MPPGHSPGTLPATPSSNLTERYWGKPDLHRRRSSGRLRRGLRLGRAAHLGRRTALRRGDGGLLPRPRGWRSRRRRSRRPGGPFRAAQRRQVCLRRTHVAGPGSRRALDASRCRRVPATAWQTASRCPGCRSVASGALVLAWGVAQWDYLLPETLTVSQAAAPTGTIAAVLVVAVFRRTLHRPGVRPAVHPSPEEPPTGRRRPRGAATADRDRSRAPRKNATPRLCSSRDGLGAARDADHPVVGGIGGLRQGALDRVGDEPLDAVVGHVGPALGRKPRIGSRTSRGAVAPHNGGRAPSGSFG